MLKFPIYLDNNATTPCDPRVVEAMLPYFTEKFGNAASKTHSYGRSAADGVGYAREQVARLIGASPEEIIFTSGATEADNLAIKGVIEMYAAKGNHIITCVTEHKAVLDTCQHAAHLGADITYLPVNKEGRIDLQQLESAITNRTVLIAIMYANNETGTLQPIREISAIAKKYGLIFFSDAVQAVGKLPVNVMEDGIDLLSLSAHKIYGPKGVGALFVRRKNPRVKLTAQIDGGGHEKGIRSGTLNVPGIVGLGKACELAFEEMDKEATRLSDLRNRLEAALLRMDDIYVNGSIKHRLPNVSNLSFGKLEGAVLNFDNKIAVSSGSACTSASLEPSFVLKEMGLTDEMAYASLRFSLGRFTTEEEIDYTIRQVSETVPKLRGIIV